MSMKLMTKAIDRCADCVHLKRVTTPRKVICRCSKAAHRDLSSEQVYRTLPDWCPLPDAEEARDEGK